MDRKKNKNERKLFLKKIINTLISMLQKGDFFVQIVAGNPVNTSATKNIYLPE